MSAKLPVIYLSGPMTGMPNFNREVFNSHAAAWREAGFTVLNPAELELPEGYKKIPPLRLWKLMMRRAIATMMQADVVVMLHGWGSSRGATQEHSLAMALGFEILAEASVAHKDEVRKFLYLTYPARSAQSEVLTPAGYANRSLQPALAYL